MLYTHPLTGPRSFDQVRRRALASLGEAVYYAAVQQDHALAAACGDGADAAAAEAERAAAEAAAAEEAAEEAEAAAAREPLDVDAAGVAAAAREAAEGAAAAAEAAAACVSGPAWDVPVSAIAALTAALAAGQGDAGAATDGPTQHYAAKTVENVLLRATAPTDGSVAAALSTQPVLASLLALVGRAGGAGGGAGAAADAGDSLRACAASGAAHLLRLRPELSPTLARDERAVGSLLSQLREGGAARPAQAAATCLILLLCDADARRALAASAPEPLRRRLLRTAVALLGRAPPLLRAKGCLAAALLCSLGTPWLAHAVHCGLLRALEAVAEPRPTTNTGGGRGATAGAEPPADDWQRALFVERAASSLRRVLRSLQPALLRHLVTPHFEARQSGAAAPAARIELSTPSGRTAARRASLPSQQTPGRRVNTPAGRGRESPEAGSGDGRDSPSVAAPSWDPPDTEASLELLGGLARCAPVATALAPPALLSSLAACLHALCAATEADNNDPPQQERVSCAARLGFDLIPRALAAAEPPALAALAADAPRLLSPSGLLGALCRSLAAWPDAPTRLAALRAATSLAQATVAGSPHAAAAVAPTLVSHLLPHLASLLSPLLGSGSASGLTNPREGPNAMAGAVANHGAREVAAAREVARCALLLLAAAPCAPAELAAALDVLRLLPPLCRALRLLCHSPAAAAVPAAATRPEDLAPLFRALAERPAAALRHGLAPLLAAILAPGHADGVNLNPAPPTHQNTEPRRAAGATRGAKTPMRTPHRQQWKPQFGQGVAVTPVTAPLQAGPEALHPALDAAYLLLCFGVSVCRQQLADGALPLPSASCSLTPAPPPAAYAAAAHAAGVVAQLGALRGCAPAMLVFLGDADARLAEKAAHCVLQVCELLALAEPHAAAAAVLGGGGGDGDGDILGGVHLQMQMQVNPAGIAALAAVLATNGRSELGRCVGRAMAVLRAADELSFRAAVAAHPGLSGAMAAASG